MFQNRIPRYADRISAAAPVLTMGSQRPSTTQNTSGNAGMVLVPVMTQQAPWQTQLYRLAYERALSDKAPPRHFRRFFSSWN